MSETRHIAALVGAVFLCAMIGFSLSESQAGENHNDIQPLTVVERNTVPPYEHRADRATAVLAVSAPESIEEHYLASEREPQASEETVNEVSPVSSETTPVVQPPALATQTEPANSMRTETAEPASSFREAVIVGIHRATNAARAREGLDALAYDAALATQAAAYSNVMLETDTLSHTDANGCNMTCRFRSSGYKAATWGENLAVWKSSYEPTVDEVVSYFVAAWLRSDGHRDNLLSSSFTHQGIGIAREGNTIYVTVHFAKP